MNKKEALEIISMIVDGLNPYEPTFTLEDIPEKNPATIRALCTAIASLIYKRDREELASCYRLRNNSELGGIVNGPLREYFIKKEKEEIIGALTNSNYNDEKTAETLGITIFELDKKIKIFNLDPFIIANKYLIKGRTLTLDQFLRKIKKEIIFEALNKRNFNITSVASLLGIPSRNIKSQINKFNSKDTSDPAITANYLERSQIKSLEMFINEIEKKIIIKAFQLKNSNFSKTASLLGITLASLIDRIEKLNIEMG